MKIEISDDFDLDKITNSGQAFRIKPFCDGIYRFVTGSHVLYIKPIQESNDISSEESGINHFDISMYNFDEPEGKLNASMREPDANNASAPNSPTASEAPADEWDTIWVPYFDLGRSYSTIRKMVPASDEFLSRSAQYGEGLRILKQDAWEMLITFIISQRKNIPAIKESVEKICRNYGRLVKTPLEELYLFPSAEDMKCATLEELKKCSLGYRDTYIMDAVNRVSSGALDLKALETGNYDSIFNALLEVRGVGAKVSNCICLFAYAQLSAAPVDTWIAKVIDRFYAGTNPFPAYGEVAGIMQQYIFYYAQTHKEEFN